MNFNDFLNMDVNMKKFTGAYNNYASKPLNFGGGKMKIKDLIKKYLKREREKREEKNKNKTKQSAI